MVDPKDIREQRVREAKTALILDAAQKVFAEKGYHETRLEDIAAAAGFSKASLYNYYEDKETIFLTIMIRMHEKILEVLKCEIKAERPVRENLRAVLKTVFHLIREKFAFSLSMSALESVGPHCLEKFQQHHEKHLARFELCHKEIGDQIISIFAAARAQGEISTPVDDAMLARYSTALVRETFSQGHEKVEMPEYEVRINKLITFLEMGLGIV
jgi:AcrR family transcriptional regulator